MVSNLTNTHAKFLCLSHLLLNAHAPCRGRLASERKLLFRAAVHAALIRSTYAMLHRRATPRSRSSPSPHRPSDDPAASQPIDQ